MVKFFCDVCGSEVAGHEDGRLKGEVGRISFEVMTAIDGTWNGGHVCRKCLISAINASQEAEVGTGCPASE